MEPILARPLPPGCPWSGFRPPNVDWCEEELCSWVVNPADTWSNLAYLAFGSLMMVAARERGGPLRWFGPAAWVVGLSSGIYHASYTYLLQLLDFLAMYVFCFLVIALNAGRLGWIAADRRWRCFAVGVFGMTAITPLLFEVGFPIQALVAVLLAIAIGQEIAIARRDDTGSTAYASYFAALLLLTAASVFSLLDVTRTWCDPSDHWLQGHAIWHLLSAAALYALYHFYAGLAPADGTA